MYHVAIYLIKNIGLLIYEHNLWYKGLYLTLSSIFLEIIILLLMTIMSLESYLLSTKYVLGNLYIVSNFLRQDGEIVAKGENK